MIYEIKVNFRAYWSNGHYTVVVYPWFRPGIQFSIAYLWGCIVPCTYRSLASDKFSPIAFPPFKTPVYVTKFTIDQSCKRADYFRPEPENISPNPARTRKLIWSPTDARKNPKVNLRLKNLAMLPSYFDYIFVHLRQKARLRPERSPKFLSTLGPKPTRKARPDLQLCNRLRYMSDTRLKR